MKKCLNLLDKGFPIIFGDLRAKKLESMLLRWLTPSPIIIGHFLDNQFPHIITNGHFMPKSPLPQKWHDLWMVPNWLNYVNFDCFFQGARLLGWDLGTKVWAGSFQCLATAAYTQNQSPGSRKFKIEPSYGSPKPFSCPRGSGPSGTHSIRSNGPEIENLLWK